MLCCSIGVSLICANKEIYYYSKKNVITTTVNLSQTVLLSLLKLVPTLTERHVMYTLQSVEDIFADRLHMKAICIFVTVH